MHEIENEVDAKVQDAIRHAEAALQEAEHEVDEVAELLGDQGVLLERIRSAKESCSE